MTLANLRLFGLAGLALAAAACATDARDVAALPQDKFPITVRQTQSVLEVPVAPHKFALSIDEKRALQAMAAEQRTRGHGPIVIALPVGGDNDEAAVIVGAEMRDVLYAQGLRYEDIRGDAYDADGRLDAPLVVIVQRYEAEAPNCHDAWADFARSLDGANTANFGCAVQANLAAVVTDPADLLGPRPEDPSDPARRAMVFDRYRAGETTITQRADTEGASVSDAVE